MRVPVPVPAPYGTRPLRREDAPAVVDVLAAYDQWVLGEVLAELADIEADWQQPSADLETLSTGIFVGDRMVGFAEVAHSGRAGGCVHPDHWGRGVGSGLARWTWELARSRGLDRVGQTLPDADARARALFAALGYEPLYASWVLSLPDGASVPTRELPAGYVLRDFVPGRDERVAYSVIEDAFGEWEGRVRRGYDDWAATVLRRPGFAPWQLRLVQAPGGTVVGACVLHLDGDAGWVHQLAVA